MPVTKYLLETSSTDGYLLEDGSGDFLLETSAIVTEGVGASSGVGAASGAASAVWDGVGSSVGTGAATGVSGSTDGSVGSSSGVAAATGLSSNTFAAVGSAAGVATALGISADFSSTVGSAVGTSSASGVGEDAAQQVVIPPAPQPVVAASTGGGISPHLLARGAKTAKKVRKPRVKTPEAPKAEPQKEVPKPAKKPQAAKTKKAKPEIRTVKPDFKGLKIDSPKHPERKVIPYDFPKATPLTVVAAVGTVICTSSAQGRMSMSRVIESSMGFPNEITEEEFSFFASAA